MAWIFLAESEDSPKHWKDIQNQLPTVKMTVIAKGYYLAEWQTCNYPLPPSGMTLELLMPLSSPNESTSSTADSPAKTLALQAAEKAWMESEADYFSRSQGSLAKYDRDSSSWRTYQQSLFEEQNELLESFAAYGMTVDGVFFPLRMWERHTDEIDGGYWPTLTASDGTSANILNENTKIIWLKSGRPRKISNNGVDGSVGLSRFVKLLPTLQATDWKRDGRPHGHDQKDLPRTFGGKLNPTWCEWLMGYPTNQTELEPWAMQWYQPKRARLLKD